MLMHSLELGAMRHPWVYTSYAVPKHAIRAVLKRPTPNTMEKSNWVYVQKWKNCRNNILWRIISLTSHEHFDIFQSWNLTQKLFSFRSKCWIFLQCIFDKKSEPIPTWKISQQYYLSVPTHFVSHPSFGQPIYSNVMTTQWCMSLVWTPVKKPSKMT